MKIAIIGRTQLLYETAVKLSEEGHKISCIITAPAAPEYTRDENDFKRLAQKLGAHFFLSKNLDEPTIQAVFQELDIGISINWVSIINEKQIELFRYGILNSHHGDLPKYRGNACSNWAILKNEQQITNTIHFMQGGKLDCGRIISQEHFQLSLDSTIEEVYKWAEKSTPILYAEALSHLEENSDYCLKFADPDSPEAFRCYPRLPEDGFIDWNRAAIEIHNLIRASSHPFAGAYTYHWHKNEVMKLVIHKSQIVKESTNDLAVPGQILENNKKTGTSLVQCGNGVLSLLTCQYPGEMERFYPGKRWKSIRMRLGVRTQDWLWKIQNRL